MIAGEIEANRFTGSITIVSFMISVLGKNRLLIVTATYVSHEYATNQMQLSGTINKI